MSYTPVNSDAANVAAYTIARLNATSPSSVAVTSDQATAIADSQLGAIGLQTENNITGFSPNSYSNTPLADVPGSSWTFTAPVAKKYIVHVDTLMFFTAGANPFGALRLVVNGDAGPTVTFHTVTLNLLLPIHTMHSALCVAGANTIKLQWSCNSATYTVNVNASTYANYIVSG